MDRRHLYGMAWPGPIWPPILHHMAPASSQKLRTLDLPLGPCVGKKPWGKAVLDAQPFDMLCCTGTSKSMLPRFSEYEVIKLRSTACSRQEHAIFSPHIHRTWEAYFCWSLYILLRFATSPGALTSVSKCAYFCCTG